MGEQAVSFPGLNQARRGCIMKLMRIWMAMAVVVIAVIVIVRRSAVTEPERILAALDQWVSLETPAGFYPYRKNSFFGASAITFWDEQHQREDGRTTALIAFFRDSRWPEEDLDKWPAERLAELESQFSSLEFKVRAKSTEILGSDPWDVIHIYSGIQAIDNRMEEALACYRFLKTRAGIVQAHTLGLESSFPLESQLQVLRSVVPKH